MVGKECFVDNFTQPAGGTPNPVARPPLDDAGAQSGKPPKAIKTEIRQMQPLSRLHLYGAVHYEMWLESLPHDLINIALGDVLKRVTEATVSEHIIQELQGMCPRIPATGLGWFWHRMNSGHGINSEGNDFFEMGATNLGMEEWMLRNVERLRAQYQQSLQERAQRKKGRARQGGKTQNVETPDDRIDEDDVGNAGGKSTKRNPTERSKKKVRKLRKRPGAIKWVRKLGRLLENQHYWDEEIPQWARSVWEIILSMNKSGKQYLKDEARADREKQKQREKKARKKAKRQASKASGKKSQDSMESSSNDSTMSSSDESSDNSSSSSESTPKRGTGRRRVGAVLSGAREFTIVNGKRHFSGGKMGGL